MNPSGGTERDERLQVVHHFPGRLRVRARSFRKHPERATQLCETLAKEPGISSAQPFPLTGSLLILYEPSVLQLPRLIRNLLRDGGLSGVLVDAEWSELADLTGGQKVRDSLGHLNEGLRELTRGQLDLRVAVPGALASLGLGKLLFGRRRIPEWYDLLFWSFVTFVNLNPPKPEQADAGDAA